MPLRLHFRVLQSFLLIFALTAISLSAAVETLNLADEIVVSRSNSATFSFPVRDAESRQIRLSLDVRFDWKTLGGYTGGMSLNINGRKVEGRRLLNKPLKCRLRNGTILNWGSEDSASYIIMYAGRFSDEIKTNRQYIYGIIDPDQDPFRFVFDLSGLTVHNQENVIEIQPLHSVDLVVANLKIEYDPEVLPRINDTAALVTAAPTGPLRDYTWRPKTYPVPRIRKSGQEAMEIEFQGKTYILKSRFSLPEGKWQAGGQGEINNNLADKVLTESIDCGSYRVQRRFEILPGRIKVHETYSNTGTEVTGVLFEHALQLPEEPEKILRCGRETELARSGSSSNPSIVAILSAQTAGLIAEDDIFRNQHYLQKAERELIIGNRSLGLAPGAEHTLEWSLFFLESTSYYDFVNAVRQAWGSNFTWLGPLAFPRSEKITDWNVGHVTPSFIRRYLEENPVRLVMTHLATSPSVSRANSTPERPWIGHGTAIPQFDWWCGRTAALVSTMKEVSPEVEVYAYLHKNLCSEPGHAEKYRDSAALNPDGEILSSGQLGLFQPTLNNSYGKALANVYRYMVTELGAHLYMDEICLSVTAPAPYPEWDNCTVEINPFSHQMVRKLSIPNLLIRPWLEEMIAFLKQNKRKLLANGPPATRTLQNHQFQHFVEAGAGESGLIAAHLSTPLAWQGYVVGLPAYRYFQESLSHGALTLTWSGGWNDHLFPFTPMQLGPGYLIGQERIVTRISGVFGWGDDSHVEIKMYDGKGDPVEAVAMAKQEKAGIISYEVRMPSDHVAVLIRKKTK